MEWGTERFESAELPFDTDFENDRLGVDVLSDSCNVDAPCIDAKSCKFGVGQPAEFTLSDSSQTRESSEVWANEFGIATDAVDKDLSGNPWRVTPNLCGLPTKSVRLPEM
eukprot:398332-Karenia_brevis.AAC.1